MTTTISECRHCGKSHGLRCPEVKALEYFESGELKRVEFVTPADCVTSIMSTPLVPHPSVSEYLVQYPFPQPPSYESPGGFKPIVDCGVSGK